MAVGFGNLSGDVQAALTNPYPDIGQTYYVVDPDFRTAAQGWTQADGTGPLDLWSQRAPGKVFYGAGSSQAAGQAYSTDVLAIQAAIDAMVDFRGDTLMFTPGTYELATAINLDVESGRFVGPPTRNPASSRAVLRGTGAGVTPMLITGDNTELGFVQLHSNVALADAVVNLTAADFFHFHDGFVDFRDATAATTVIAFEALTTACAGMLFERFLFLTDGSFGALLDCTAIVTETTLRDFTHVHNISTGNDHAVSIFKGDADGLRGNLIHRGVGLCAGVSVVTDMATTADQTIATTCLTVADFRGSVGYGTATNLVSATTDATAIDEVQNFLAIATGTTQPVFTSGGTIEDFIGSTPYISA